MGLHQTKELLHSKRNSHQTEDTAHIMEENLCQLLIQKGINIQNLQRTQKSPQRINTPMKKWAHELNGILKGRGTNGQ
jgi:glycine cleavage system regulatory protein